MKGRVILIDCPPDAPALGALVEDGRLIDLVVDGPWSKARPKVYEPRTGAIYRGKCKSVSPGNNAVFMDIGDGHSAFLRAPRPIRPGESRLVQITSHAEPGKGLPATDRLVYKGQLVILTPDSPGVNVSRQIKNDAECERLRQCVADAIAHWSGLAQPEGSEPVGPLLAETGIIIRSSAKGATYEWIRDDLRLVLQQWIDVRREAKKHPDQHLLYLGSEVFRTAFCEWSPPAADRIAYSVHGEWDDFLFDMGHYCSDRAWLDLVRKEDGPDLFDHYGVWDEIEKLKSPRVDLPSGGWMAVEATRAMVTVDVNTAGEFGGGAALSANLDAAKELPRQLRLRGLGGQVTIDFAPLPKKERKRVEEALKAAFRRDPVETTLAGWTPLGNFELQRKRERRPLAELLP